MTSIAPPSYPENNSRPSTPNESVMSVDDTSTLNQSSKAEEGSERTRLEVQASKNVTRLGRQQFLNDTTVIDKAAGINYQRGAWPVPHITVLYNGQKMAFSRDDLAKDGYKVRISSIGLFV